jgi:hypothetical protein
MTIDDVLRLDRPAPEPTTDELIARWRGWAAEARTLLEWEVSDRERQTGLSERGRAELARYRAALEAGRPLLAAVDAAQDAPAVARAVAAVCRHVAQLDGSEGWAWRAEAAGEQRG